MVNRKGSAALDTLSGLFGRAGIEINGGSRWDIQIHDDRTAARVLAQGSLGLGESYMDGWWDCASLDGFFERIFRANLAERVTAKDILQTLRARLFNLQDRIRSWQVGKAHYDVGNDLFSAMLDSRMTYSCGYWKDVDNLEDAQTAKLDLVCRKLGLKSGMRLLDIGCGWGSLMKFAAEKYGVSCVGLTISAEQAKFARLNVTGPSMEIRLADYRSFNMDGREKFDRIASIGMFEHVGHKNYVGLFETSRRSIVDDGLFLLHTIGRKRRRNVIGPWFDRYIFPNGELPSLGEISNSVATRFVIEDVHNFGADYDQTLLAWHERFEAAWPELASRYGDRFYRMWRVLSVVYGWVLPCSSDPALANRSFSVRSLRRIPATHLAWYSPESFGLRLIATIVKSAPFWVQRDVLSSFRQQGLQTGFASRGISHGFTTILYLRR